MALPNYILKLNLITIYIILTLCLLACGGNESEGMTGTGAPEKESSRSSQSSNSTAEQSNNNNSKGAQEEVAIEINVDPIGSLNEQVPAELSITVFPARGPVDQGSLNITKIPAGGRKSINVIPGQSAIQAGDSLIVAPPKQLRLFANTVGLSSLQNAPLDSEQYFGSFSVSGVLNKASVKMALPWKTEAAKLEVHTYETGSNSAYQPHREVQVTQDPSGTLDFPYHSIEGVRIQYDLRAEASGQRTKPKDTEGFGFLNELDLEFARLVRNGLDEQSLKNGVVFSVADNPLARASVGHGFAYIRPLKPENWDMIVAKVLVQKPHLHQEHEQKLITVYFPIRRDRIDILGFNAHISRLGESQEVQSFSFVDVFKAEGYEEALERWFHIIRAEYVQVGYRSTDFKE